MTRLLLSMLLMLCAPFALRQTASFPAKPIKIIVPFNAGSAAEQGRPPARAGDHWR